MSVQLDIKFPLFPEGTFEKVKEKYVLEDYVKLQKKIDHLNHVVAGYRSIEEQRKKQKANETSSHTKGNN